MTWADEQEEMERAQRTADRYRKDDDEGGRTMTDEQGYNGWKNYETWAVALWIDNDEGSYTYARSLRDEVAEGVFGTSPEDVGRSRAGILADLLKGWHDEMRPELEASVWADLLGAALSEVDWYEIAENYLSEQVTA